MRWLILINALGAIAAAAYVGFAATAGGLPWGGMAATLLFLAGLSVPFFATYLSLDDSFREIESTRLEQTRRKHFPPAQELFTDAQPDPVFPRRSGPVRLVAVMTALAVLALGYDVADRLANPPPVDLDGGTIRNF